MIDTALKFLGYLAVAVGFVAGIMAIVPIMLWVSCGLLANKLMDSGHEG